jgi:hypothetical protein
VRWLVDGERAARVGVTLGTPADRDAPGAVSVIDLGRN